MFLRKYKMLLKQLFECFLGGFRGFPKIHHSFPFFSGLFPFKIGIYQTFPRFSAGKVGCYKGTNNTVYIPNKKIRFSLIRLYFKKI